MFSRVLRRGLEGDSGEREAIYMEVANLVTSRRSILSASLNAAIISRSEYDRQLAAEEARAKVDPRVGQVDRRRGAHWKVIDVVDTKKTFKEGRDEGLQMGQMGL